MNQILQTEIKKKNGPVDINKVVIFFASAIILFGIIMLAQGSYAMFIKKSDNNENQNNVPSNTDYSNPVVDIQRQDDDIVVKVSHVKPISKIIYTWNNGEENVIDGGNKTELTQTISLPYGTNSLYVKVIDINGKQTEFQKDYVVDGDGKPIIDLTLTNENKIKIKVQDSSSLSYILYKWNDGDETRVEANVENLTIIEKEVEIPVGLNTLKVQAVNANNIIVSKELEVKGIRKPVVSIKKDGDALIIRAEDEVGMKVIDYTLNGQTYQINYGNKTVIEYRQPIVKGENTIELRAENQDGGITEVKAKCINQ